MVPNSQKSGVLEQLLHGVVQRRKPTGFRVGVGMFLKRPV